MRGKKAKALRRLYTNSQGVLFKASYKAAKRGTLPVEPAKPKARRRTENQPVAKRAGAKPMHLVRKLIDLQVERELRVGKNDKAVYGMMPRHRLKEAIWDFSAPPEPWVRIDKKPPVSATQD